MYQLRLGSVLPIPNGRLGDADLRGDLDLQKAQVKAPLPDVLAEEPGF